jgi:C-terminal processing protease CtpA/Prc
VPKLSFMLTIVGCLLAGELSAQLKPPRYSIGVNILGPDTSCSAAPLFIGSVGPGTPAALAGIHAGDQLQAVDGVAVRDLRDAAGRITSANPGKVVLTLKRNGADLTLPVSRERSDMIWSQQGFRQLDDGALVPADYTDAQAQAERVMKSDLLHAIQAGKYLNVFPGHYPADMSLYYPGFELFVRDHGQEVIVGGVEDGPAKKSGIRWGDQIISVDGIDPRGHSLAELETLFSSPRPAT